MLEKVGAKRPSANAYVNFVSPQDFFIPRRQEWKQGSSRPHEAPKPNLELCQ